MTLPDLLSYRREFPVLETGIYLNSNSTGALPRSATEALADLGGVFGTWRDEIWKERFFGELAAHGDALAALVGGAPGSVVTDANVATLLGRVVSCFSFRERPRLVTTTLDFPTAPFLFKGFSRYGAEPVVVPSKDGIAIDEEALLEAIDERTQLVCIPHATPGTGALVDLGKVVRKARSVGALVAVDAFATVGAVPLDVVALDLDFALGGSHKFLCGMGAAFLYVKPSLLASLEPAATGWMGTEDPLAFGNASKHASGTRRFLAGTPNVMGTLVSKGGLAMISEIGVSAIRKASLRRTGRVIALAEEARLGVVTPKDDARRGAIACLSFPGAEAVAKKLLAKNMVASYRGALRVAPHFYTTDDEIDTFMAEVVALAGKERD
jgi:kynureninase